MMYTCIALSFKDGHINIISPPPSGSIPRLLMFNSIPGSTTIKCLSTDRPPCLKESTDGSIYKIRNYINNLIYYICNC